MAGSDGSGEDWKVLRYSVEVSHDSISEGSLESECAMYICVDFAPIGPDGFIGSVFVFDDDDGGGSIF